MKRAAAMTHFVYSTTASICGERGLPPTVDAAAVNCPICRASMLPRVAESLGGKIEYEYPEGTPVTSSTKQHRDWFWVDGAGVSAGTDRQDLVRLRESAGVYKSAEAASVAYLLALRERIDQLLGRVSLIPLGTRVKYKRPGAPAVAPEEGLGYLVGVDFDDPVRRAKPRYKVLRDGFADSGVWMNIGFDEVVPAEAAGP